MVTEAMKLARFDHPKHGTFDSPEAVLKSDKLSDSEKSDILSEWKSSLTHILHNEPNAPAVKETHASLDDAMERLAAGRF
ncbi:hypothetical protein [Aurantimonas sp. VKM B-3413]|uniref:hypothetical protein n=1 Tax=Aurantimonas sp. VKM B-3413 TaxID=2779401 RepID=UPI001E4F7CC2|nr:hypothetical protein [Aurantimonas sp. VKM B-3413]MCB8839642.1 hypothetical protein [Aurantimonas sp. VKM B-3413]